MLGAVVESYRYLGSTFSFCDSFISPAKKAKRVVERISAVALKSLVGIFNNMAVSDYITVRRKNDSRSRTFSRLAENGSDKRNGWRGSLDNFRVGNAVGVRCINVEQISE